MRDRARRYLTVLIFMVFFWSYLVIHASLWLDAEIACALDEFCEFYSNIADFWHIVMGAGLLIASMQIAGWIEGYWDDDDKPEI